MEARGYLQGKHRERKNITLINIIFKEPEEIAHFTPELDSVIHSFSVTETHAIFFFYPFVPNIAQMWAHNFHAFEVSLNTFEQ